MALLPNEVWLFEVCLHILKEHDGKMCSELCCFGLLNLVTTGICNLYLKEFAELSELSIMACLFAENLVL